MLVMLRSFSFIILTLFVFSCNNSPLKSGVDADENKYNLTHVQIGMTEEEVVQIMGYPHATDSFTAPDNRMYDVWFYVTQAVYMGQKEMLPRNYTPLVFKNGYLEGYGYPFLNHLKMDIEQQKKSTQNRGKRYTNDADEWPKKDHGFVPPPPHPSSPNSAPSAKEKSAQPTFEEETPVKEKKAKKKKPQRGVCPEDRSPDEKSYWWE